MSSIKNVANMNTHEQQQSIDEVRDDAGAQDANTIKTGSSKKKNSFIIGAVFVLAVIVVVAIAVPLSNRDGKGTSSSIDTAEIDSSLGVDSIPPATTTTEDPTASLRGSSSPSPSPTASTDAVFYETNEDEMFSFLNDPAFKSNEFYMVNVLGYRTQAVYKDGRETNLTGFEANQIYSQYVLPQLSRIGGQIVFRGNIEWDSGQETPFTGVAIVRYPNSTAFFGMTSQPEFQKALAHKEAALGVNLIMACERLESPHISWSETPSSLYVAANATNPETVQVNIIHFRETAQYQDGDVDADNSRTGEEAYNTYSTNAIRIVIPAGVRNIALFKVKAVITGPIGLEEIRINWFPSNETWRRVIEDPTRLSFSHHRYAGMEDDSMFLKTLPIYTNEFLAEYQALDRDMNNVVISAVCNICGEDQVMSNPKARLTIPGVEESPECSQIEFAGNNGLIPADQCTAISSIAAEPCGCVPQ